MRVIIMNLDRHWGTFSGMGAAALQESWDDLQRAEMENQRREMEYQQKLEDDEFNLLLDHYHHEIKLKKQALAIISELESVLKKTSEENAKLKKDNANQLQTLHRAKDELIKLQNTNRDLLTQKLQSDSEGMLLKRELESLQQTHNENVVASRQTNERVQRSYELSKKIQGNTEQTFTLLHSKLATERMEALMTTKLAYTQNLVFKRILTKLIALGVFNPKDYKTEEAIVIKAEDEKDMRRQGITFAESYDWVQTHSPEKIEIILGFKP